MAGENLPDGFLDKMKKKQLEHPYAMDVLKNVAVLMDCRPHYVLYGMKPEDFMTQKEKYELVKEWNDNGTSIAIWKLPNGQAIKIEVFDASELEEI